MIFTLMWTIPLIPMWTAEIFFTFNHRLNNPVFFFIFVLEPLGKLCILASDNVSEKSVKFFLSYAILEYFFDEYES